MYTLKLVFTFSQLVVDVLLFKYLFFLLKKRFKERDNDFGEKACAKLEVFYKLIKNRTMYYFFVAVIQIVLFAKYSMFLCTFQKEKEDRRKEELVRIKFTFHKRLCFQARISVNFHNAGFKIKQAQINCLKERVSNYALCKPVCLC